MIEPHLLPMDLVARLLKRFGDITMQEPLLPEPQPQCEPRGGALGFGVFAFRDRSGAVVLPGPERPAAMADQHLDDAVCRAV